MDRVFPAESKLEVERFSNYHSFIEAREFDGAFSSKKFRLPGDCGARTRRVLVYLSEMSGKFIPDQRYLNSEAKLP